MPTTGCPSLYWETIPGLEKDGPLHHQCSHGKADHTGKHYCGCGHEWTDSQTCRREEHRHS